MTKRFRIPQHALLTPSPLTCAQSPAFGDPVQLPLDLLPQPTLPQKSQPGSHTQFPVLAWKKSLVIAPHVLILACTLARQLARSGSELHLRECTVQRRLVTYSILASCAFMRPHSLFPRPRAPEVG